MHGVSLPSTYYYSPTPLYTVSHFSYFPGTGSGTFVPWPCRVTHAPQEEPGYWCDSCSLFVCGLESGNLTFCVLVYALSAMCVYHLGHFAFTQISCKDTKMFSFSWNSWSLTKSLRDCPNLTPNSYPNHRFHSKYFHGWSL